MPSKLDTNPIKFTLGDSLVHQQWHPPSSWIMKRDFRSVNEVKDNEYMT